MAAETSRSSVDSYIGSLISLTSKSEIRYEGILYNINTEESSIGLRNVRSYGTEGRKKDGPQLMPSDKVYEYILFRGSDIKDLQLKSSLPAQPTQPINSDPAIIQSHYPTPVPPPTTIPAAASNSLPDLSIQNPHMGPGSTLQGGPNLYQPSGNLGSWGPMPPPLNPLNSGLAVPPMYWPGLYTPPNGLPQLHQPPSSLQQPMQYPNCNANLPNGPPIQPPEYPSTLLAASTGSATDTSPSLMQNKPPNFVGPTAPLIGSLQSLPSEAPTLLPLVTPGQLLQSGLPTVVSSQSTQAVHGDVEVVQVSPPAATETPSSEPSGPVAVPTETQPPLLPLPPQPRIAPKPNGAAYLNRQSYNYRGRERGRGRGASRSVMKFTEEFDFNAMNEKFNKDEIWGTLGKTNKKENNENVSDEDEYEDENDADLPKLDVKPVYSKDDFFDTLSCNSLDKQSSSGRPRFSEQMKLDTETFGEFSRHRGGRGGRWPYRGRGGGYYGRGGGYYWRGRGGRTPNVYRDY
ncbi:hypothetical protein L1987_10948 [Smallanthus sonchifolius]|uniref:Uncharacterized protein n=1 Tax=Smallanthus sonchifolius TaxID=185202 RepID=A0ACB9JAF0_9ASTR|nr:hypothetical protein L1987_10948 [Smallanthus sonchifolius]